MRAQVFSNIVTFDFSKMAISAVSCGLKIFRLLYISISRNMAISAVRRLKVALLQVLRHLAGVYGIAFQLNRDSDSSDFKKAYKRLCLRVHPDKGGQAEHQQQLNDAFKAWENAEKDSNKKPGRKRQNPEAGADPNTAGVGAMADPRESRACYRIQGVAVMLTYQGSPGAEYWNEFVLWWETNHKRLGVKYWCATLETNSRGNGNLHAHVMMQFKKEVDLTTHGFQFKGKKPRADANDVLGEGWGGKRFQKSVDRGFFYVWADKLGTVRDPTDQPCVAGSAQAKSDHSLE